MHIASSCRARDYARRSGHPDEALALGHQARMQPSLALARLLLAYLLVLALVLAVLPRVACWGCFSFLRCSVLVPLLLED